MAIEYVNRMGDRYFLYEGKTPTGKPKYYMSRKPGGAAVDAVPEGFEIYESPENGIVTLRRIKPSPILATERDNLARWTRDFGETDYAIVAVEGKSLVVYTPGTDPAEQVESWARLLGPSVERHRDYVARNSRYCAMFRFSLKDSHERLFRLERWCFRGGIDGWIHLDSGHPLEQLARKYLPHLNKESFFDLM
jgi:hypothetical protein